MIKMKVIIEKDVNDLEIASYEFVKGLHPAATDREVAMAHAFKSVKALCPVVKDAA